ncbi:hypothetical protein GCM10010284_51040 [Streptomyces rubiginosohelvolus]|uniref:Uncharacterized protein n=1 Tax=Streptomyces rubiginosohelvolus TaxID=67362 RepID=A0ABQ3CB53_9ACTN|nr:hypothetical protein GCM10010284_51040 [Streptomyces rubiginosohelvolus]GGZ80336.1 hypothetical protein GCM10010328_63780 [Streptomyces pluricolorescens]
MAGSGALRLAAVLSPRPDERVRTALSDPPRIGVVAGGVSVAPQGSRPPPRAHPGGYPLPRWRAGYRVGRVGAASRVVGPVTAILTKP